MPATVNEQVVDQATAANLKMLADMAQEAMGLSIQNATANQQSVQAIINAGLQNGLTLAQSNLQAGLDLSRAITTISVKRLFDQQMDDAISEVKLTGSDLQDKVSNLGAALAGVQQDIKAAVTSPPQTGTGGAFGSETGLSQQIGLALANLAASQAAIIEMLKAKS